MDQGSNETRIFTLQCRYQAARGRRCMVKKRAVTQEILGLAR